MKKYHFSEAEFSCLENLRVPLAVYQFLDKRVITRVLSAGFCDLFDFETREQAYAVMTSDIYSTAHPDDASRVADAAYRFATQGGRYEVVYRVKAWRSSTYKIVHSIGEHVFTDTGERLAFVWYTDEGSYTGEGDTQSPALRSVFRSALREESMLQANYYDYLTGLPNMSYFLELVDAGRKAARSEGKTPAVLFIDLNGMKYFNRKYGFAEGDKLLLAVSKILVRQFESNNCSRFGQDHFAVFTETEDLEDKLDAVIAECASANDGRTLTIRIGMYSDDEEEIDPGTACDRAKYACDSLGSYASGYAFFNKNMLADAENRHYILDNLDRALAEKWIKVYYQPIIRSANGRVCDEEALSRWIDPVRGLLSPADFIPTLEEAKLIYKLDLYVVEQVLEKMKAQAEAGLYIVPQSVNLSRSDFDACDIVEEIRRRVDAAGIARDKLTVEITESVVGRDPSFIREQVGRFQKLGFQVWMDDFGSGYSSLDVLQDIHFDVLKFDMRFMQRFNEREEGKIILTELVRMAIGLGIETVCEGVETAEQVEFLREIGCTKLQGYYFCKAIPPEEIVERNRKGIQIGFENPEETEYYTAIGRINLYDAAVIAQEEDQESLRNYFNTLPMAIIETTPDEFTLVRCNNTYRSFMTRMCGVVYIGKSLPYSGMTAKSGLGFLRAARQCGIEGNQLIVDETMPDGSTVHALIKRVAVNPVTGTSALAVAVLAVIDKRSGNAGLSYAQIANALSDDYFDLFYVNLETEDFIQYSSSQQQEDINLERHGKDFFNASRQDALKLVYPDDRELVIRSFTKENVLHALQAQGSFTLTYRLLMDGEPVYVNMKAVRMNTDDHHIIIGVNNINAQMQEKQALERLEEERTTYARICALSGDYICIYTVDPVTDRYTEYNASSDYEKLELERAGEDFFQAARRNSVHTIFSEDLDRFLKSFTKENVLREIRNSGVFELQYRLMIRGEPKYVILKAAMVQEKDGPQLIIGVNNIDARVRRDMAFAHDLSVARSRANLDSLTGVKNRTAYLEAEEQLNAQITDSRELGFAVAVFNVRGLKEVNHTRGRHAGDQVIRQACAEICALFKRSPVFRIEDDRFAVIARGHDYERLDELFSQLDENNRINADGRGPVIAYGLARYVGNGLAGDVYALAEKRMREDQKK